MFVTCHRYVNASEPRGVPYLVEHGSKLFVEKEAGCRTILSPPARATFGFEYEARRELELHGMARSLDQSASSLAT